MLEKKSSTGRVKKSVPETSSQTITPEQLTAEIKKRAEEIFVKRGNNPGTPLGDWLEAEREIKSRYGIPS